MKYNTLIGLIYFLLFYKGFYKAQVISNFNWNSNPPTAAAVGPNATSIGANASSSPGGVGGTNGLNPGIPTIDINMVIPNTGGIFNVNNIDISIDYRRNESTATMFRRGVFISNNGAAVFRVTYRVNSGGTPVTITSGAVSIPQDNIFRNYRFTYDDCTGIGRTYVNNVVAWTSPTPTAGLNLYWVGDGNMIVGQDMDGAGNNIPNLDNFIVQAFTCGTLPVELLSFTGLKYGESNLLKWRTATETNNDFFTIEQSTDGMNWNEVKRVLGSGNSLITRFYSAYIDNPEKTINYYRLKQTDFDGQTKTYETVAIDNSLKNTVILIKTLDLLGREVTESYQGVKLLYYSDGSVVKLLNH